MYFFFRFVSINRVIIYMGNLYVSTDKCLKFKKKNKAWKRKESFMGLRQECESTASLSHRTGLKTAWAKLGNLVLRWNQRNKPIN